MRQNASLFKDGDDSEVTGVEDIDHEEVNHQVPSSDNSDGGKNQ